MRYINLYFTYFYLLTIAAGCSFTDPEGMEGWVGLGGWLYVVWQFTCPRAITRSNY